MILERILESKRDEIARAKRARPAASLRSTRSWGEERRGFERALRRSSGRRIIAEIKRASPSKGVIRADFDPVRHARQYEDAGAVCLSVLTDEPFFGGTLRYLQDARRATSIPLLRKDFVVDPYQVIEARAFGADAVLLIVAALDAALLDELLEAAREETLDVLVEVHDERELEAACSAGATLLGINNRDLRTFETTTDVTRRLMPLVPDGAFVVSESGLGADPVELSELEAAGVGGFLIGETLMRQPDPGAALRGLLEP